MSNLRSGRSRDTLSSTSIASSMGVEAVGVAEGVGVGVGVAVRVVVRQWRPQQDIRCSVQSVPHLQHRIRAIDQHAYQKNGFVYGVVSRFAHHYDVFLLIVFYVWLIESLCLSVFMLVLLLCVFTFR